MATESKEYSAIVLAVKSNDWTEVLEGVHAAHQWIARALPGEEQVEALVAELAALAFHPKWEVRREIANAAAQIPNIGFESAIMRLTRDDNARVQQAAEHALQRRRDWRHASTLGRQHEDRINSTLDDIEARFGVQGREAVRRASQDMANTFARELYHEVIKLLSPLAMSADRLRRTVIGDSISTTQLLEEADRIDGRVSQLRSVLDSMRAYTAQPKLVFSRERLSDVVEEAISLIREDGSRKAAPQVTNQVGAEVMLDMCRPRLIQAVTNILANAVESYSSTSSMKPITVRAVTPEGRVDMDIVDEGCGMSEEAMADATALFTTSKPNGTGFGLPLASKIVESEHSGRLEITSTKGVGTSVRFLLPLHQRFVQ